MKALRGLDGTLLYLDFDGVLHHEDVWWHPRHGAFLKTPGHQLFEHTHLLEKALEPYPDVRIVLSTSWVRVRRFSRAVKRLPPGLRERVVGATFHTRMNREFFEGLSRGTQIVKDVERRKPRHWLALDDDVDGWPSGHRQHLIQTDEVLGISAPGVLQELQVRLERFQASIAGTPFGD